MAETPKKTRAKRRNYELELRSVKTYIETKLEILREPLSEDPANAITLAKIGALESVLDRMARAAQ
jgi:hypothetical protein